MLTMSIINNYVRTFTISYNNSFIIDYKTIVTITINGNPKVTYSY